MLRSLLATRRLPLLVVGLLSVLLLSACVQRLQAPGTPTPSSTPVQTQPTPTPIPTPTATPSADESPSVTLIQGQGYFKVIVPGATIYYQSGISDQIVHGFGQVYTITKGMLRDELGITDVAPMEVYLASEAQFRLFAQANDFNYPSFLAGFYSYTVQDGQAQDPKIYLNAEAKDLVTNMAHELTHVATPWLPTWLSEGVANYIGYQVGNLGDSYGLESLNLKTRQVLRDAAERNAFLSWDDLQNLDWTGTADYVKLELAYAESWEMVNYVADRYSSDGLHNLLDFYRSNVLEGDDPFLKSLAVPEGTFWQQFTDGITVDLTPEELVGLSLCNLTQFANQGATLTRDWNQLLSQTDPQQVARNQLNNFGAQWDSLATQTAQVDAPGQAVIVRDLWSIYFQTMSSATDALIDGDSSTAQSTLSSAGERYSLAIGSLQGAMAARPWLSCGQ